MVNRKSITVNVLVDGTPLPEYGQKDLDGLDTIECWIPSEAGKEFSVQLDHQYLNLETATYVYVDGKYASGGILRPYSTTTTVTLSGVSTSATTERSLMFAGLQLSDDDNLLNTSVSPDLGTIKVDYKHVLLGKVVPFNGTQYNEVGPVHERSKKAISHSARLGAVRTKATTTNEQLCTVIAPLLSVIFRYRPLSMLQATGIAPSAAPAPVASSSSSSASESKSKKRPRSTTPDDAVIDISSDDEDDIERARLEAELQRLKNKKAKVKQERNTEGIVKKEKHLKREKVTYDPNEVIDLS